jgi:hypothetical protein
VDLGKAKSRGLDVDTQAYYMKQLLYRTGGNIPEELKEALQEEATRRQLAHYESAYAMFNRSWTRVVVPLLKANNVPPLDYAKYKAFTNEYIKKVLGRGKSHPTETKDQVLAKYEALKCDRDVLEKIINEVGKVGEEEEGEGEDYFYYS